MIDTKAAREFVDGGDYFTGPEIRTLVHSLADEIDRLQSIISRSDTPKRVWVTDGNQNKLQDAMLPVEPGWTFGRTMPKGLKRYG